MRIEPPSPDDPAPPFEQLRAQIAGRIASGDLPAGERLPTVRALADQAGLAVNTAARVYRELEADGLISTEGRRGSFVRSGAATTAASVDQEADAFATAARRAGLTRAQAVRELEAAWERGGR